VIDESNNGNYDSLYLCTRDQLSCSVMATKCERVFSAAKRILPSERNALGALDHRGLQVPKLVVEDRCGIREVAGVPSYAVSRD